MDQIVIDPRVKCKVIVGSRNFMSKLDVKECMALLNPKKSESFDRFPVCALYDSCNTLLEPMSALFSNIYKTKKILE